ncbi:unnamed protein product, partial [Prorocentrum cordatum]
PAPAAAPEPPAPAPPAPAPAPALLAPAPPAPAPAPAPAQALTGSDSRAEVRPRPQAAEGQPGQAGRNLSVAVCFNGLQRHLLSWPVRYHYVKHVEEPLQRYGFKVDRYLSVVKPFAPLSVISATYNATALREVPEEKFYTSCNSKKHIVDRKELLQYVSVRDCYEQIEAVESAANARYTWIYRMRTDMVHLADIPLHPGLSQQFAYVSHGGMSSGHGWQCMNDHIFLCPRRLCRPYFFVIELWDNQFSCGSSRPKQDLLPEGWDGPPSEPFVLPKKPNSMQQWYFFRRYTRSTQGRPCNSTQTDAECCGLLRELEWWYVLARNKSGKVLSVDCHYGIRERHGTGCPERCREALKQCTDVSREFERLCTAEPGHADCAWVWQGWSPPGTTTASLPAAPGSMKPSKTLPSP